MEELLELGFSFVGKTVDALEGEFVVPWEVSFFLLGLAVGGVTSLIGDLVEEEVSFLLLGLAVGGVTFLIGDSVEEVSFFLLGLAVGGVTFLMGDLVEEEVSFLFGDSVEEVLFVWDLLQKFFPNFPFGVLHVLFLKLNKNKKLKFF